MNERERNISEALKHISDHAPPTIGDYFVSELPFCHRKIVFKRFWGKSIEANPKMIRGTLFHLAIPEIYQWVDKAEGHPELVHSRRYEMTCVHKEKDWKITGHCDMALVNGKAGGDTHIIRVEEWKYSGARLKGKGDLPLYYMAQVNLYAYLMEAMEWGVNIVHPETHNVTCFDGQTDADAAKTLIMRAEKSHEILTNPNSAINLLGKSMDLLETRAEGMPHLKDLFNDVVSDLPEGPEYEFECKTRWATCPFYFICRPR